MLTKTDIENLSSFQIALRQTLAAKLRALVAQDEGVLNELLKNKTVMNPVRKSISEARNVVAQHRSKFIEPGERQIANMYNLELNALGEILIVFAGKTIDKKGFVKFFDAYKDLLNFTLAIEGALKTIEPKAW